MITATPSGWAAGTATGAAPPGVVARRTMTVAATAAAADLRVTTAPPPDRLDARGGDIPRQGRPLPARSHPGRPVTRALGPHAQAQPDRPLPGRAVCGTGSRAETR